MDFKNLPEIEKAIGGKVKLIRSLRGKSQEEVARLFGITFQQVQKYENGANRISPGKLLLLSQYLDTPVSDFFKIEHFPVDTDQISITDLNPEEIKVLQIFRTIENPKARKKVIELCQFFESMDGSELKEK